MYKELKTRETFLGQLNIIIIWNKQDEKQAEHIHSFMPVHAKSACCHTGADRQEEYTIRCFGPQDSG